MKSKRRLELVINKLTELIHLMLISNVEYILVGMELWCFTKVK